MRVALVYPETDAFYSNPPLGILHLSTYLRRHGVEVDIIDLSFSRSYDVLERHLREKNPEVVGITATTLIANYAFKAAEVAKKVNPHTLVILGGPHITALPEPSLRHPNVDAVGIGEGEETLLELVRTLEGGGPLSSVKGIGYKEDGQLYFTPAREFIQSLDDIGIPDRSLLSTFPRYLKVVPLYPRLMPYTHIIASRGCPAICTFCQPVLSNLFGRRVRYRSPQSVVEEMEQLVEGYGVKSISFSDDVFCADKRWSREVCEEILRRGLNRRVVWMAQTRIPTVTPELLKLMKEAGCIFLCFGVESGNDYILNQVYHKGQTPDQIRRAFRLCQEVGLMAEASVIIGAAEDTRETIRDTVRIVREINPDVIDIHYLTPIPGAQLYDDCLKSGRLGYTDWEDPSRYNPEVIKHDHLTREELEALYAEVERAFYERKSIFRANRFWYRYIWNITLRSRSPRGMAMALFQFFYGADRYLRLLLSPFLWLYRWLEARKVAKHKEWVHRTANSREKTATVGRGED